MRMGIGTGTRMVSSSSQPFFVADFLAACFFAIFALLLSAAVVLVWPGVFVATCVELAVLAAGAVAWVFALSAFVLFAVFFGGCAPAVAAIASTAAANSSVFRAKPVPVLKRAPCPVLVRTIFTESSGSAAPVSRGGRHSVSAHAENVRGTRKACRKADEDNLNVR